jgi:hypothetical protein
MVACIPHSSLFHEMSVRGFVDESARCCLACADSVCIHARARTHTHTYTHTHNGMGVGATVIITTHRTSYKKRDP